MTILSTIFARSGLRPPADPREIGRPLYAYQVTDSELEELRREVAWDIRQRVRMVNSPAGAFCLFAAEHLCRSYAGGAWRWSAVFDALEVEANQPARDAWVRAGMAYWHRPIVQTDTQQRLLTSLVCEGGLPLHLLADGRDRYLKDFFRTLIREAERLQVSAAHVVSRAWEVLPQTLQNDTVAGLGAVLADAVIGLRRGLPDAMTEDPFDVLSRRVPDWRRMVPIRLDAGAFAGLLRGLLREARTSAGGDNPVEITTVLVGPPFRIERRASIVDRCSVARLAALLGVPAERLVDHARITLSLLAANGERPMTATAHLTTDNASYALHTLPGVAIRHDGATQAAVRLVATVGGRELACVEPPGGSPLLPDHPWVFDGGDRPVRVLRRQGDHRSAASQLLVAVPPQIAVSAMPPARTVGEVVGRSLLSIEGSADVKGVDEAWQIRAASTDDEEVTHELSGTLARAGFAGSEYWCGLPRVQRVRAGGVRTDVPPHELQVRAAGQHAWRPAHTVWGDIQLRSNHDGSSQYRARMLALPPDMELRVDAARSTITCRSEELRAVVHAQVRHEASGGACSVPVAQDVTTSTVSLELELRAGTATLQVPAPIRRARFVGRDEQPTTLTVLDRLGQVRAVVVSPDLGDEFGLEARIFGHLPWTEIVRLQPAAAVKGVWELALDSIRDHVTNLLAISYHLDEEVELRVCAHGRSWDVPVLRVRRYEVKPSVAVDADKVTVTFTSRELPLLGERGLERLKLELRPITAPDTAGPCLDRSPSGDPSWTASTNALAEHPTWLLIGRIGERVRLRPVLVGGGARKQATNRLEEALMDPSKVRRRDSLRAILGEIGEQWERPEWDTVNAFLSTLGTMPSTTFDLVDIASELTVVAAGALFRCAGSNAGLDRIWRGFDELPFLWENVPLDAWVRAARALARYLRTCSAQFGIQEQTLTDALLAPHLSHGPTLSKFFETIHAIVHRHVPHCPAPRTDLLTMCQHPHAMPALQAALHAQVDELLRRHDGDWWPSKLAILDATGQEIAGDAGLARGRPADSHDVINLPLKAGFAVGQNRRLSPPSLLSLRRVRTFDPTWFEFAHAVGFTIAAASLVPQRS